MNRKWIYLVMSGALLLGVHSAGAQEPPAGPPPKPDIMGPIGQRMELLGFGEMHPGKVVSGAPYSAVAVTETKQTLADGNTIDRKVQSNIFRDGQGRTRRETTFAGAGPLAASGQPRTAIMIHDPVASTAFVLHPDAKTAEQLPTRPGGPKRGANLQNRFEARIQQEIANGTLKKEDLGVQTINGISAQGTRYTRTIPAGQVGNANPIMITNEQWYSPDLQVVVKSTRTDPRFGVTTYTLSNIQRTEPAATLFTVPSDYTVTQGKPRAMLRGRRGPGAPPPPPSDAPPTE
ncbi:MAG TPA: hypothetical protein VED66_02100 [Candidatus Sulfotelmatobacter sp.]|nr:hypothetical protein [Candidatus Sulfotelmatobacter sp.]